MARPRRGILLAEGPLGIATPPNGLLSFGQDDDGELWVLVADGTLAKVVSR